MLVAFRCNCRLPIDLYSTDTSEWSILARPGPLVSSGTRRLGQRWNGATVAGVRASGLLGSLFLGSVSCDGHMLNGVLVANADGSPFGSSSRPPNKIVIDRAQPSEHVDRI